MYVLQRLANSLPSSLALTLTLLGCSATRDPGGGAENLDERAPILRTGSQRPAASASSRELRLATDDEVRAIIAKRNRGVLPREASTQEIDAILQDVPTAGGEEVRAAMQRFVRAIHTMPTQAARKAAGEKLAKAFDARARNGLEVPGALSFSKRDVQERRQ